MNHRPRLNSKKVIHESPGLALALAIFLCIKAT
jgi:hypothetical protein